MPECQGTPCSKHAGNLKFILFDPVYFLSAPGSTWQACLKYTGVKLELLIDYDMPLMVEKGIRAESVKKHIDMLKQTINI